MVKTGKYFVFSRIGVFSTHSSKHCFTFWVTLRERHFFPSEAKHFTTCTSWGASSVSHCDSEAINVEIIQTGCSCLPQACPCIASHMTSLHKNTPPALTEGGKKNGKQQPCLSGPAAAGSSVSTALFSDRMPSFFDAWWNNLWWLLAITCLHISFFLFCYSCISQYFQK